MDIDMKVLDKLKSNRASADGLAGFIAGIRRQAPAALGDYSRHWLAGWDWAASKQAAAAGVYAFARNGRRGRTDTVPARRGQRPT